MSKITDPATLEACDFVRGLYQRLGSLAPRQFSPEEQHALFVLSRYIESRAAENGGAK